MDADKDEGKIQLTLTIPKFPSEKPGGDFNPATCEARQFCIAFAKHCYGVTASFTCCLAIFGLVFKPFWSMLCTETCDHQ